MAKTIKKTKTNEVSFQRNAHGFEVVLSDESYDNTTTHSFSTKEEAVEFLEIAVEKI